MPPLDGLRVHRSAIHGYGVVTVRTFRQGELLFEADGVPWRAGEDVDDTWSLEIAEGVFLDLVDQARWVNHSCEPNVRLEKGVDGDRVWARMVAKRALAVGEELAFDYAFPEPLAIPCHCGAPTCRGRIVDRG